MVDAWDEADDARRIASRARTVGEHFATEQPLLAPVPTEPFETGRWFTPRVDRYAQVAAWTRSRRKDAAADPRRALPGSGCGSSELRVGASRMHAGPRICTMRHSPNDMPTRDGRRSNLPMSQRVPTGRRPHVDFYLGQSALWCRGQIAHDDWVSLY